VKLSPIWQTSFSARSKNEALASSMARSSAKDVAFFMYGRDADELFEVAEPILRAASSARGGFSIKRYGDATNPDAIEVKVYL
jgi:hypothetical protein